MLERCRDTNYAAMKCLIRDTCELPVKIILALITRSETFAVIRTGQKESSCFIEKLPNELLVKIFQYCDSADFANLRLQCTRFNQLLTTCDNLLAHCYRQHLVTCLTVTFNSNNDAFVLTTFRNCRSNKKNSIEISRTDVLRGCYHNLRYCFWHFRILGLQFSNLFLCSRTLRYFCDLLSCCWALEPKTLRLCDCYVAHLQHDELMRLMNLCSKYLIVLSFINLTGVRLTLFHDDLFQAINRKTLHVLIIQSIQFHITVPTNDQQLSLSDSIFHYLPHTMRKIILEKCQNITADGICNYVERYFNNDKNALKYYHYHHQHHHHQCHQYYHYHHYHHQGHPPHRSTEMVFRQCKQLTTAAFERAAQFRPVCFDGQDPAGEYIMSWVKRRQYHLRHINDKKLVAIEIDNEQLITRSGHSSPSTMGDFNRHSIHSVPFLSICHFHSPAALSAAASAEQILRMARKWNSTQLEDRITVRTDKGCSKTLDESELLSVFHKPIIQTASAIRPVKCIDRFILSRFSFPHQSSHSIHQEPTILDTV